MVETRPSEEVLERAEKYIKETSIPGLLTIQRPTRVDNRGFFREVLRLDELEAVTGEKFDLKQWNHSRSLPRVIRAIHAENWNKIVYPLTGTMFAAIADIRSESPAFGKVETFTFNTGDPEDLRVLYVPKGLANSICVVGDEPVDYIYLVDKYYDGKDIRAVAWDDPDLAINWPVKDPIVSERDRQNPTLRELFPEKFQ